MKTIELTEDELSRLIAVISVSVDFCKLKIVRLIANSPNDEAIERYQNILIVKGSIQRKLLK